MDINLAKNKLYYLLLNSLTLDHIEYGYLYPFLEQAGGYAGYYDIILAANQLSHQIQPIYRSTKQLQELLEHEFHQNEPNAYLYAKLNCVKLRAMHKFNRRVLFQYNTLVSKKQITSFKIPEYFLEKQKDFQYRFILDNFEQTIFTCLLYILCNKIWKIKYWYPLIFELAFDCQEFTIAKHFIEKTKAELKMIAILIKYSNH